MHEFSFHDILKTFFSFCRRFFFPYNLKQKKSIGKCLIGFNFPVEKCISFPTVLYGFSGMRMVVGGSFRLNLICLRVSAEAQMSVIRSSPQTVTPWNTATVKVRVVISLTSVVCKEFQNEL